jgi:hypothetical protein
MQTKLMVNSKKDFSQRWRRRGPGRLGRMAAPRSGWRAVRRDRGGAAAFDMEALLDRLDLAERGPVETEQRLFQFG